MFRRTLNLGSQSAASEVAVDVVRSSHDQRYALDINDPHPLENIEDVWAATAQMATIGIFLLLLVVALSLSRPILLPILTALLIGTTFAPVVKRAHAHGISPWITAVTIVMLV